MVRLHRSVEGLDCEAFDELGWDGKDLLTADIDNFLGTGLDCELELER